MYVSVTEAMRLILMRHDNTGHQNRRLIRIFLLIGMLQTRECAIRYVFLILNAPPQYSIVLISHVQNENIKTLENNDLFLL